jgi:hypothetical protein
MGDIRGDARVNGQHVRGGVITKDVHIMMIDMTGELTKNPCMGKH